MGRRRPLRLGFRGRVLGFSALMLVAATGAGLVVQRTVLLRRLDNEVAASLDQERRELEALAAGRNPATGQAFEGDVRSIFDTFLRRNVPGEGEVYLTFVDGAPYKTTLAPEGVRLDENPELVQRWSSLQAGETGSLDTGAGPVDYLAVPLRSEGRTAAVFVVANFVQGERDEIESGIRVEAAVGAVVLVAAIGVAWVIAGRLLRPVRDLTDTARSITESDLARRIPVDGDDEIAELADTFNEMLDRLAGAFAAQRAFIDDAGHELRTPITIVRGHLELMGDDPQDRRETVALVIDELDRMARIVADLLLLAKAEQPDFVQLEPVEIRDLTTELLMKARALGDRDWRLDACASGRHDGEVHLWVRDSGPGVDPADRDRIFERFARGGRGPRPSDGAGLGLAIARAVADGHAGRVDLVSRPGAGARFTLVWPDHGAPSADDPPEQPASEPIPVPERTSRWPES
jgi:two-component system OmpR family sensor kinase